MSFRSASRIGAKTTLAGTRATLIGAIATLALLAVGAAPALAARPAAKPTEHGHGGHEGGSEGGSGTLTGNDVSYPQCGGSLPSGEAFGIVGINDGLANTLNPCFGPSSEYGLAESELYWAQSTATGISSRPKTSLYVNTADPGDTYNEEPIGDWPSEGATPSDGECLTTTVKTKKGQYVVGEDTPACAWIYGYQRAEQDVAWLGQAAEAIDAQSPATVVSGQASAYPWWLDVETANSWEGLTMNVADLEGMVAAFEAEGASTVGVYSTASQWTTITGGTPTTGLLTNLPDWLPGARSLSGAESNCLVEPFTGGGVTLAQWISHHSLDGDYAC